MIKIGDLVRWFEYYVEGIVKDSGLGIIMDQEWMKTTGNYGGSFLIYHVWKIGHDSNMVIFESSNIEIYNTTEGKNE